MIEITLDQMKRVEQSLKHIPDSMPKAVASAINRASESARTEAVRKTTDEYTIKAGKVRETIDISKASTSNLFARVRSRGRPRPLSYFKIRPSRPTKKRPPNGVYAQVKQRGGGEIEDGFVAKVSTGFIGVFTRKTKSRYPLEHLYGPSVPQMLESTTVQKFVEQKAMETLEKRLDHEIARILKE